DDDADRIDVIDDDLARRQSVTGGDEAFGQRGSGLVVLQRTRIRDRQHRDVERQEGSGLIDRGHGLLSHSLSRLRGSEASEARSRGWGGGAAASRSVGVERAPPPPPSERTRRPPPPAGGGARAD